MARWTHSRNKLRVPKRRRRPPDQLGDEVTLDFLGICVPTQGTRFRPILDQRARIGASSVSERLVLLVHLEQSRGVPSPAPF